MVSYLLNAGADTSVASPDDGATALHTAAGAGCLDAMSMLALCGANVEARDAAGRRPHEVLPCGAGFAGSPALQPLSYWPAAPLPPPPPPPLPLQQQSVFRLGAGGPCAPPLSPDALDGLAVDPRLLSTPSFSMYQFKVRNCPKSRAHDWMECPFVHPGEKARRRDPLRFTYSPAGCLDFKKSGSCRRGDGCEWSHGVFEAWLHPERYRTQICNDGGMCARRTCFFAHSPSELRTPELETGGGVADGGQPAAAAAPNSAAPRSASPPPASAVPPPVAEPTPLPTLPKVSSFAHLSLVEGVLDAEHEGPQSPLAASRSSSNLMGAAATIREEQEPAAPTPR